MIIKNVETGANITLKKKEVKAVRRLAEKLKTVEKFADFDFSILDAMLENAKANGLTTIFIPSEALDKLMESVDTNLLDKLDDIIGRNTSINPTTVLKALNSDDVVKTSPKLSDEKKEDEHKEDAKPANNLLPFMRNRGAQLTPEQIKEQNEKYTVLHIDADINSPGFEDLHDPRLGLLCVVYRYSKDLADGVAVNASFRWNKSVEFTDDMLSELTEYVHNACKKYGKPIDGSSAIINIIPGVFTTAAVTREYAFSQL